MQIIWEFALLLWTVMIICTVTNFFLLQIPGSMVILVCYHRHLRRRKNVPWQNMLSVVTVTLNNLCFVMYSYTYPSFVCRMFSDELIMFLKWSCCWRLFLVKMASDMWHIMHVYFSLSFLLPFIILTYILLSCLIGSDTLWFSLVVLYHLEISTNE